MSSSDIIPIAVSEDHLLRLVTEHNGMVSGIITAEIAGWMLRLNTSNRPLQRSGIARFVHILERGQWVNTGEPIIISREGVVNDGQHRLTAIHETGIQAECDVRFGIHRSAFHATGTGSRRSAGDVMHISGVDHAKVCAAIAKILWHYHNGSIARNSTAVENVDLLRVITGNPSVEQIAKFLPSHKMPVLRRAWWGGALAIMAIKSSFDIVQEFSESVDSGQGVETAATRKLHERLVAEAMTRSLLPVVDKLILAVKTWNAWTVNRPVGVLRVLDSERSSAGFPDVWPAS